MTIDEMHFDVKMKVNKVDSSQSRNFRVPEIDWFLNEAIELFVKLVAQPRLRRTLGFETSQRSIDDIRTLVREREPLSVTDNVVSLPTRYLHFLGATAKAKTSCCDPATMRVILRQHDDEFEHSVFDKSSYKWRELNASFQENGIQLYPEEMTVTDFRLTYILKPQYVHNAQASRNGTYKLPSGAVLNGKVDCELAPHTHREIVDLAVMLALGQINLSSEFTMAKLNLNGLTQ